MKTCLLGLDMGSTNTKAIAMDSNGSQIAYSSRKTMTFSSRAGFYEYDLEQMWENVLECVKEVISQLDGYSVCAIGISSLGETNALIDREGHPLHRAITWFDQRAIEQTERIGKCISDPEIHRITGQRLSPKFGLPKLLWMLENNPSLLNKAAHFMSVEDFILFRLCGKAVTDYSIASRSLCFDIESRDWSKDILHEMGIPFSLFPVAYPGGTVVGHLQSEVAHLCGLPAGIPICTGGHDHACALLSSGAYATNGILDSTGTAETTICACEHRISSEESFSGGICYYPHFGKRIYRAIMSAQACGASIEWFLRVFGSPQSTGNVYASLFEEAASVSINDVPIYVPYLRGLQENAEATGVFAGLRDMHGRSHMIRALAEGICFAIRDRLDHYEQASGEHYERIHIVGGLAQSNWFLQLKSNIMNRQTVVPNCTEAAALGAAMLAGIAIELIDENQVGVGIDRSFVPDETSQLYDLRRSDYLRAARFCNE